MNQSEDNDRFMIFMPADGMVVSHRWIRGIPQAAAARGSSPRRPSAGAAPWLVRAVEKSVKRSLRGGRPLPARGASGSYFTLSRSMSKISVAPGGMSLPAPLAP
jgi:hypothetical protein